MTASRRGLYARRALRAGERVARRRHRAAPGDSLAPARIAALVGSLLAAMCRPARRSTPGTRWSELVSGFNILVTAGSRRVPLVQAIPQALASLGVPGR